MNQHKPDRKHDVAQITNLRYNCFRSGENRFDDLARNVGQSEVAAGVAEGQFFVVKTQQVQNRRQIIDPAALGRLALATQSQLA